LATIGISSPLRTCESPVALRVAILVVFGHLDIGFQVHVEILGIAHHAGGSISIGCRYTAATSIPPIILDLPIGYSLAATAIVKTAYAMMVTVAALLGI